MRFHFPKHARKFLLIILISAVVAAALITGGASASRRSEQSLKQSAALKAYPSLRSDLSESYVADLARLTAIRFNKPSNTSRRVVDRCAGQHSLLCSRLGPVSQIRLGTSIRSTIRLFVVDWCIRPLPGIPAQLCHPGDKLCGQHVERSARRESPCRSSSRRGAGPATTP